MFNVQLQCGNKLKPRKTKEGSDIYSFNNEYLSRNKHCIRNVTFLLKEMFLSRGQNTFLHWRTFCLMVFTKKSMTCSLHTVGTWDFVVNV